MEECADYHGSAMNVENNTAGKEFHATSLLVKGQPQSFVDFFLLTHETHAHSIKPTYPGYEPQILGGDEEVAQESIPILSRQLVRAETGHQRNDHKTVADAYHALGSHFERAHSLKKAVLFYKRSLDIAQVNGYGDGEKSARLSLGFTHQRLGDLEAAADCHEEFLVLGGDAEVQMDREAAVSSLIDIYTKKAQQEEAVGNLEEALEYLKKCSQFAEKVNDVKALSHIDHRLGVLYQEKGDYPKALYFHSKHLEASKKLQDHAAEGKAYCGMAECYEALNDPEKAITSLELYLDMGRMQDSKGQARACGNLGIVYYNQGNFEQAVIYFEKLFEVARTLENQKILDIARINLGVARGAARMNDYIPIVKDNLMALLQWKSNRMPFSNRV